MVSKEGPIKRLWHSDLSTGLAVHALADEILDRATADRVDASGDIVIYGFGELGRLTLDVLTLCGIAPKLIVDRSAPDLNRTGPHMHDLVHPDEVPRDIMKSASVAVCIAKLPVGEIIHDLRRKGWVNPIPSYLVLESLSEFHPVSNGWRLHSPTKYERDVAHRALDAVSDDMSRAHLLSTLAWHALAEDWVFVDYPPIVRSAAGGDYLLPEVKATLSQPPRVLDVGAHTGTFLLDLRQAGLDPSSYIAIEPDIHSQPRLVTIFTPDCQLIDAAVGSGEPRQRFQDSLGFASQLWTNGNRFVDTVSLDAVATSSNFIKIHCEGGDLQVLETGRETLGRPDALIATTIYHSRESFFGSLDLLASLEDKSLLVRSHAYQGTGCVAYLLPRKRVGLVPSGQAHLDTTASLPA